MLHCALHSPRSNVRLGNAAVKIFRHCFSLISRGSRTSVSRSAYLQGTRAMAIFVQDLTWWTRDLISATCRLWDVVPLQKKSGVLPTECKIPSGTKAPPILPDARLSRRVQESVRALTRLAQQVSCTYLA
ncbi:hypothetical protein V8C35DRAFT_295860 [Trichoderma chlorosporum]